MNTENPSGKVEVIQEPATSGLEGRAETVKPTARKRGTGARVGWCVALILAGIAASSVFAAGKSATRIAMENFMRQKLPYSQGILEGLALERFDLIAKNALKMRQMSQTNSWLQMKQVGYLTQTTNFQQSLDALYAAASDKNLDAATEAYTKVTRNCVECHRLVRLDQHLNTVQPTEKK